MKNCFFTIICVFAALQALCQPTISSVNPGVAIPGATVTLSGTGFNTTAANNIVYFGATKATVSGASATTLSVTVPTGATATSLSVLNTGTSLAGYQYGFLPSFDNTGFIGAASSFSSKVDFLVNSPFSLATGDLDGDGKPDLVTLDRSNAKLWVFRNTSSSGSISAASFASPVSFTTGSLPSSVTIADVDQDGQLDIVVSCQSSSPALYIFRNTASSGSITSASFAAAVTLTTGSLPGTPAAADVDGDGKTDLVVSCSGSPGNIYIFRNIGSSGTITSGSFASASLVATAGYGNIAVGDIDGDGKIDVALVDQSAYKLSLLRNNSTSGSIAFDTRVDISVGFSVTGIAIADMDGDNKPDIITGGAPVSVFRNVATAGSLSSASLSTRFDIYTSANASSFSIADFNGDHKPDFAYCNVSNNRADIWLNTISAPGAFNSGSFVLSTTLSSGSQPTPISACDIDGDSKPDVICGNGSSNSVSVFRNNPQLLPPIIMSVTPNTGVPGTTVSISGSGFNSTAGNNIVYFGATKATVIGSSATSLSVTVPAGATLSKLSLLNTSTAATVQEQYPFLPTFNTSGTLPYLNFNPKADLTISGPSSGVAIGDIDGDGKADLVVSYGFGGYIFVYRNISSSGSLTSSSFSSYTTFATAGGSNYVRLADMDNDGKLDIVTAATGNSISVLRNTATSGVINASSFATSANFSTVGNSPADLALADFDQDGKIDIATTCSNSNAVYVLRNNSTPGTLSFNIAVSFATGISPKELYAVDLDGDGKPDIAVANYSSNTISVLRNTSVPGILAAGSFASGVSFPTGTSPWGITAADIDGDGKPDLAVTNYSSSTISVFRNTASSGTFTTASLAAKVDFNTGTNPKDIAAGDIDGDGKVDIAAVNYTSGTFSCFRNIAASGSITTASLSKSDFFTNTQPSGLAIGDLDGDGKPDVATTSNNTSLVSVFRNNPQPAAPTVTSVSPNIAIPGASVSITGSGFNTTAANNVVYFGATKGTVTSASATTLSAAVPAGASASNISVLNTGLQLVARQPYPFLPTFSNNGAFSFIYFSPKLDYSCLSPSGVAMGDLDGDGRADFAASSVSGGYVVVFRNISTAGAASFSTVATPSAGSGSPGIVRLADLDNDGKLDIVVINSTGISVIRNASSGIGSFSLAATLNITTAGAPSDITLADFDGDGKIDAAITIGASNNISVLRNVSSVGNIALVSASVYTTGLGPRGICSGDFDGDGKPDIAVTNSADSSMSVLLNTASPGTINPGSFAAGVTFATGRSPWGITSADIDGDGRSDLLVANNGSSTFSVFRNTATSGSISSSSFAARVDFTTGSAPKDIASGDLNGDGKPDVAITNNAAASFSSFRNTAVAGTINAASFDAKNDFATSTSPTCIAINDADGDNKPDVIVSNNASNSVSVFRNNPQPLPPAVTSVSPNSAIPGTTVTINGSNFNATAASNTVYFGATKAAVTGGSTSALTVTVPAGATLGPVSVLNTSQLCAGQQLYPFIPTFNNGGNLSAFTSKVDLATGTNPSGIATGDIDGDGKADMIVSSAGANTVKLYHNISTSGTVAASSFDTAVSFTTLNAPGNIKLADVDNDGKPDIVVVNTSSDTVSVFRNTATSGILSPSSLATRVDYRSGTTPNDLCVADFDGDGKIDLAMCNGSDSTVAVLKNNSTPGTLLFATAVTFSCGSGARGIYAGDLDGDAKPDIAVTNTNRGTVSVLFNTTVTPPISFPNITSATFAPAVEFTTGTSPWGVSAGDIDGDGKPELLVTNNGAASISVFHNTATSGTITTASFDPKVDFTAGTAPRGITTSDFNGDGKTDIALVNGTSATFSVFRNTATLGVIDATSLAAKVDMNTGTSPGSITASDIDGDYRPDILTANGTSSVSLFRNYALITPPAITSVSPNSALQGATITITGTNFNTTAANNAVYFGAVKATVLAASATSLSVTVPSGGSAAAISVLNTGLQLSGQQPYAFLPTFDIAGFRSDAVGFAPKVDFSVSSPYGVAMGDIDGDGKPDMVVVTSGAHTLLLYRNISTSGSFTTSSFSAPVSFTTSSSTNFLRLADMDNDGKLDIVIANQSGNSISVFRNTATSGSFSASSLATSVDIAAGASPNDIRLTDIDGDGKIDIATTNNGGSTISILQNTSVPGALSFGTAVTFASGSSPRGLYIGDLDGDGKPDMAVANSSSNTMSVFFNTSSIGAISSSSFAAKVDFSTSSSPWGIMASDIDGDGKPELLVTNSGASTISVFSNVSSLGSITSGSFILRAELATGAAPHEIAIGDFNGDSKPDVAVVCGGAAAVSVFRNNAVTGIITSTSLDSRVDFATAISGGNCLAVNDIDGDGKPDLAVGTSLSVSVLRNSPLIQQPLVTSVTPASAIPGTSVTISGIGFNTTAASNIVYFGATKGTVTASSATSLTVTVPTDAVMSRVSVLNTGTQLAGQQPYLFLPTFSSSGYQSTPAFLSNVDITAGTLPMGVALGDIDGDGKSDLVVANNSANTILLYRNISSSGTISSGSFGTSVSFATGTGPTYVRLADMDNDGKLDIVVTGAATNSVSIFRNTATSGSITTASLATRVNYSTGSTPNDLALADFDNDGKIDVAVTHGSLNNINVLKNNSTPGTISLATAVAFNGTSSSAPRGIYAGDLDGDGKTDIAIANTGLSTLSVFFNTASPGTITTASFAAKVDFTTGTNPWGITAADIDGDGKPDLVTANSGTNTISVLRNIATSGTITTGSFASKVDFTVGTAPRDIAAGDLNGDGKPDITVVNSTSNTFSALTNTATSGVINTSSFGTKFDMTTGTLPTGVAIADFDGDKKPEIFVANNTSGTISVYRNNLLLQQPVITTVTPATAIPGATVTITGYGFNSTAANNTVYFGATKATVLSGSSTTLSVTLPTDATFEPITVFNSGTSLIGKQQSAFVPVFDNSSYQNFPNFAPKTDFTTNTNTNGGMAFGDIDGDGKTDMIAVNNTSGTLQIFRNTSTTGSLTASSFASPVSFTGVSGINNIKLADVNGDGKLDIVSVNGLSFSVFANNATSGSITTSSLATRKDVTTPNTVSDLALADFDKDGKLDIAMISNASAVVLVYKNNTSGGILAFANSFSTSIGTPRGIYAGDIDGDGKPDIAITNNSANTVSVLMNNALPGLINSSSFASAVTFTTGTNPTGITGADLDGDGKSDLITANTGLNTISVLRNTATAGTITTSSFAGKVDFTTGSFPRYLTAGDVNGDGKPDIVTANSSSNTCSIFINNATSGTINSSSLATKSDVPTGISPYYPVLADIDGDYKPDLMVVNTGALTVSVLRNNMLVPSPVISSVSPNNAVPGATVTISGSRFNTTSTNNIVSFGPAKAVVTGVSSTLMTVVMPYGATYAPVTVLDATTTESAYQKDIFVPKFTNGYFIGDTIILKPQVSYTSTASASTPYSGAIGDIDGDGKPDMVVNNAGATTPCVTLLLNNTTTGSITPGSFSNYGNVAFAGSGRPNNIKLADMDGDGKLDIIAALSNVSSTSVVVLRNTTTATGAPSFSAANITVGAVGAVIAIQDFDQDGKPDIAVSLGSAAVGVLRNFSVPGNIGFTNPITIASGAVPSGVYAADFDGDGKADIVTVNSGFTGAVYSGTTATVARNTSVPGTISFASPSTVTTGQGPLDVAAGDIDGDGKKDLVITNYHGNSFSVLRNTSSTGSISFATKVDYTAGGGSIGCNVADLNGDGKLDVVVSNGSAGSISVFRNVATSGAIDASSFMPKQDFTVGAVPATVYMGDLDLDGYTDIVVGNSGSNTVSVLKNYPLPPIGNTSGVSAVCAGGATTTLSNSVSGGSWKSLNTAKATVGTLSGVVTGVEAGADTIIYYTAAGGDTNSVMTPVTINPLADPGSITGADMVCEGAATSLSATVAGGAWSASNTNASVSGGLTTGNAAGTDSIAYSVTNGCGTQSAVKVITIVPLPHAGTLTGTSTICGNSSITLGGALPGGTWSVSNSNASVAGGVVSAHHAGTDTVVYNITNSCGADTSIFAINIVTMQWAGTSSADWNTASNWTCGRIPTVTDDIIIPAATTMPVLGTGMSAALNSLTVNNGVAVAIGSGATLDVKGSMVNNGAITSGKIVMSGSTLQTISGRGRLYELEVNNAAGAAIDTASVVTIGKTLYVTSGVLATNDSLVLASDATGSARIAAISASGAGISGKVKVQQYIQANYRRYRFWAHPFSTPVSLSQLEADMDITGPGGSANGFTTTGTNAPSAFRLDVNTENSSMSYDPGWKQITKIDGTEDDSNKVRQYQGLRLFMRGSKGQGLWGYPYVPHENTVAMTGPVNQGNQTITLARGNGTDPTLQDYNFIGNPYPSPVDLGTVMYNAKQSGDIIGSAFYVYNASLGAAGQYQAIPIGEGAPIPYSIQANTSYQVRAAYDGAHLHFTEDMKTPEATSYLLKPSGDAYLSLNIYDSSYALWDMLTIRYDGRATDSDDIKYDAAKLLYGDVNFYSQAANGRKLSIDARPYVAGSIIPLGITSNYHQKYIMQAQNVADPAGQSIWLHDKLLNKYTELNTGTEYGFDITADKATQGNDRFELLMKPAENRTVSALSCAINPNPAANNVELSINAANATNVQINITDVKGVSVYSAEVNAVKKSRVNINLESFPSAVYIVEIKQGSEKITRKLVKE